MSSNSDHEAAKASQDVTPVSLEMYSVEGDGKRSPATEYDMGTADDMPPQQKGGEE